MRRTHLERTLDAARNRVDAEERACDREILALQGQLDETVREYLVARQLVQMTHRMSVDVGRRSTDNEN